MVSPRPSTRLVTAVMASSSSASLPAMRSRSLARLEMTPVMENAPISRPQPARMPMSSTKVRPFTSRNLSTVDHVHFSRLRTWLRTSSSSVAQNGAWLSRFMTSSMKISSAITKR